MLKAHSHIKQLMPLAFRWAFLLLMLSVLVIALFQPQQLYGQEKLKVVTKTIEQSYPYKDGDLVHIEGEKANIKIEAWTEPKEEVAVVIKLIAKHTDQKKAIEELEYHQYLIEEMRGELLLKNYFKIPKKEEEPQSHLHTVYHIKVPAKCLLEVNNFFGNVDIVGVNGRIDLRSEYGKVNLRNIDGRVNIKTNLSDVVADNVTLVGKFDTEHSNITLNDAEGKYDIKSDYGDLDLKLSCEDVILDIDATRGDIKLRSDDHSRYNYSIENTYGEIDLPEGLKVEKLKNSRSNKHYISKNTKADQLLNLKNSFGKVRLERGDR